MIKFIKIFLCLLFCSLAVIFLAVQVSLYTHYDDTNYLAVLIGFGVGYFFYPIVQSAIKAIMDGNKY